MSESLPILLIGAGIAGPALALSLHQKGYKVILFEKHNGPSPNGSSLYLAPNGLKVLDSLGLAEALFSRNIATPVEITSFRTDMQPIIESDVISNVPKYFGFPFAGVARAVFLKFLVEAAQTGGVEVRFGHLLRDIQQEDASVTAIFENGQRVKGSFLVGCDGLHSRTRIAIFGEETATYTGLNQTAGLTLVPRRVRHFQNIYGDDIHLVSYPVGVGSLDVPDSGTHDDATLVGWACTRPEPEAREHWQALGSEELRAELSGRFTWDWLDDVSVKELLNGSGRITKFGLYDREELVTWHKDRVVLIGDAAHPTSPHLGQGANQAFEDVSLLASLLVSQIPPASFREGRSLSTDALKQVFNALDTRRIPRTSALVRGARKAGEQRVLPSKSRQAEERNENIKVDWTLEDQKILERYQIVLGPMNAQLCN